MYDGPDIFITGRQGLITVLTHSRWLIEPAIPERSCKSTQTPTSIYEDGIGSYEQVMKLSVRRQQRLPPRLAKCKLVCKDLAFDVKWGMKVCFYGWIDVNN